MKLNRKYFLIYKLINSSFTGLSIGILFTIYKPLTDPSIYSLGGIILAISMLILAIFYEKLLNITSFFYISLMVEWIMLISLLVFLFYKISFVSALAIYCLYQLTFIFDKEYLGKIDLFKQLGYLIGLAVSYFFYKIVEHFFLITEAEYQINLIHYPLILIQLTVILFLFLSFRKN